jgi:hypothetical protein
MSYLVGHIILAHDNLHRVEQVAQHMANADMPVIIHIDIKTPDDYFETLCTAFQKQPLVRFAKRQNTEWGGMSLVKASLNCAEMMLREFPNIGHVMLNSGSCIPTRPMSELSEYLNTHQGTDFIESVSIENEDWVQDGLGVERFKFYFPFSWKKQRMLFDFATWLQRKLQVNRKRPNNLIPHLGSQWWCLTRRTLEQIIHDPIKPKYDKFFSKSWIPDESYFQSLARIHSERLESRSLTWSKFDADGKPFLLYDDHLDIIGHSKQFMARKVWTKADILYDTLLGPNLKSAPDTALPGSPMCDFFDDAHTKRCPAPSGKVNPGRFPTGMVAKYDKTARKYTVLLGAKLVFPELRSWLVQNTDALCHGNLFAKDEVEFADEATNFKGNISSNRLIRNYRAAPFLANVIWNRRDIEHVLFFDLGDNQKAHDAIFKDPNAHVVMIEEVWILHYLALQKIGADTRSKAKLLHASEQRLKRVIARASTEAKIFSLTLKEAVQNPCDLLQKIHETIDGDTPHVLPTLSNDIDLSQLNLVIEQLRNEGFKIETDAIPPLELSPTQNCAAPKLVENDRS